MLALDSKTLVVFGALAIDEVEVVVTRPVGIVRIGYGKRTHDGARDGVLRHGVGGKLKTNGGGVVKNLDIDARQVPEYEKRFLGMEACWLEGVQKVVAIRIDESGHLVMRIACQDKLIWPGLRQNHLAGTAEGGYEVNASGCFAFSQNLPVKEDFPSHLIRILARSHGHKIALPSAKLSGSNVLVTIFESTLENRGVGIVRNGENGPVPAIPI